MSTSPCASVGVLDTAYGDGELVADPAGVGGGEEVDRLMRLRVDRDQRGVFGRLPTDD